jgi:low affinity Fe/Cu permease
VFTVLATRAARAVGSIWAFSIAALVVIVWAVLGPIFGYSDTWQLVINTGTTIVTFLMVFLIQNSQNRDSRAMQLKLDELILTAIEARNDLKSMAETYENERARRAAAGQER